MNCLVDVTLPNGLRYQSCQLTLSNLTFVEHFAPDDDPVDCIHLRQATVNLLFEEAVSHIILHAEGVSHFCADAFQSLYIDSVSIATVGAVCAITQADMPRGRVTLTGPLKALALLPERPHDIAEFFMGQGCPGRIVREITGLSGTRLYF